MSEILRVVSLISMENRAENAPSAPALNPIATILTTKSGNKNVAKQPIMMMEELTLTTDLLPYESALYSKIKHRMVEINKMNVLPPVLMYALSQ